jgi:hypothetical protein
MRVNGKRGRGMMVNRNPKRAEVGAREEVVTHDGKI